MVHTIKFFGNMALTGDMEYFPVGGLKVSAIGIGCWQASADWSTTNDDNIVGALRRSYELGVNLIDTAAAYGDGHSETVVSRATKDIARGDLVIATKVAAPHLRYDDVLKACDASIKRLGVKQIDLYQVHWPDPWEQVPLRHTMKALEKLYDGGQIRAIGVSNFAVRDLEEARAHLSKTDIVSNQVRYNLVQREIEEEILPYCVRNKITILAWSPLAQGVLTGKYRYENRPKDAARVNRPLFSDHNLREADKLIAALSEMGKRHGKTVAQVALNWLTKNSMVVPIPGASSQRQAEENAGSVGWRLTDQELSEIERIYAGLEIQYYPWREGASLNY
jgi:myo-inositol catabolism protein IolS